jgi:maleylacetate reductase
MSSFTHTESARRVVFGDGAAGQLRDEVRQLGLNRILLLTTKRGAESTAADGIRRQLGDRLAVTFDGIEPHLPAPVVQQATMVARREGCDGVVGLGGGAVMDGTKALAFFGDQAMGGREARFVDLPAMPGVVIPTTYSGAEMTPIFGMTDPVARRKGGGGAAHTAPKVIIYDPSLTYDLPADVSASTGMNALAHCVEAAYSPSRTPASEALALEGIRRITASLPRVVENPRDPSARTDMLAGAWLAGWVLNNASMGAHHGLCHALGGRLGVPHGVANSIMLAHVVRYNAEAVPDEVARIAEAFGADDAAAAIDAFRARLGLPGRLSEVGVTEDDLEALAEQASKSVPVRNNPRPVDDPAEIYRAAL